MWDASCLKTRNNRRAAAVGARLAATAVAIFICFVQSSLETEEPLDVLGVAWITDLHVQPNYSTEALPDVRCMKGKTSGSASKHSDFNSRMEPDLRIGRVGCPSPPLLAKEALSFLQGLVCTSTGCATSHQAQQMGAPSEKRAPSQGGLQNHSLQAAEAAFRAHPLPPIKSVVLTGDYVYYPKNTEEEAVKDWAELLYEAWKPALPDDERTKETFLRGFYYSTTLRGAPSVLICGHILPGVTARLNKWLMVRSNWEEPFALRYRDMIARYSDIVVAQLFGHEHDGEVRALLPPEAEATIHVEEGGVPCGEAQPNGPTAILTCPSLTPVDGNNPALRVLLLEATRGTTQTIGPPQTSGPPQTTGPPQTSGPLQEERSSQLAYRLADYVQYRLPLYGFVGSPPSVIGGLLVFVFEYSFQKTFGPFLLSAQEEGEGQREEEAISPRCINGSTALHLLQVLNRSAHAFALYQHHRIAGGLAVPSPVLSCSSQCVTKGETLRCMQRP
ncbi:hypothetical protein Emag_005989 [Eimeria magna]